MSVVEAVPARTRAEQDLQGLYERHFDRIFGFCRRRLRSHQEAEDATQTTFLQALRALQRGVVPVSETAWLFKIAENVCLSAHRSNGRRSERELADGAEIVELAPAREERPEALFGLDQALAAIPETQRRAFVLREMRGLSYGEIAVQAGVSVSAVEMLVFRARRSLARALENGAALKGRVAGILDVGAVLNTLKTGLGGVTAAKVLAAAAVVAVSALPAGDSAVPRKAELPAAVFAGGLQQAPLPIAAEKAERVVTMPDRAAERPAGSRDLPASAEPETHRGAPRPGRQAGDEPLAPPPPVAPPAADPVAPPPPVAPPAADPVAPPVVPPPPVAPPVAPPPPVIAPLPGTPVEIPDAPVNVPTLPVLPPPPPLPDPDDLLHSLPQLP